MEIDQGSVLVEKNSGDGHNAFLEQSAAHLASVAPLVESSPTLVGDGISSLG
jgi:hypothetical protein